MEENPTTNYSTVCEHDYDYDGYQEGNLVSVYCTKKCGHGCMIDPQAVTITNGKLVSK